MENPMFFNIVYHFLIMWIIIQIMEDPSIREYRDASMHAYLLNQGAWCPVDPPDVAAKGTLMVIAIDDDNHGMNHD